MLERKQKRYTLYKVGIIGVGWVGKSVKMLFPEAIVYDPAQNFTDETAFNADFIFICVPTPLKNNKLDCSIVQEVIDKCSKDSVIILRSTVTPGFCDSQKHKIVFIPEYFGETINHPMKETSFMIIGGNPENRRRTIELYQTVLNANVSLRQVSNYEAEVIKLSENRAIAFKVAQCQELYNACEKAKVDYYTIRDAVYGDDPRFNLWWTFIYPNKRGFDSKCLPKDVYGWCAWAESVGLDPKLTKKLLEVNDELINSNPK
jgi:UDPglucose 6-dehydrogenase